MSITDRSGPANRLFSFTWLPIFQQLRTPGHLGEQGAAVEEAPLQDPRRPAEVRRPADPDVLERGCGQTERMGEARARQRRATFNQVRFSFVSTFKECLRKATKDKSRPIQ